MKKDHPSKRENYSGISDREVHKIIIISVEKSMEISIFSSQYKVATTGTTFTFPLHGVEISCKKGNLLLLDSIPESPTHTDFVKLTFQFESREDN